MRLVASLSLKGNPADSLWNKINCEAPCLFLGCLMEETRKALRKKKSLQPRKDTPFF